ncbi:hypothetical protein GURKE_00560 [Brevundimonas phage vB_BpoS-Gurke]|uniref:Uncharacterized protein n=1 Tax=Brevundimonas phage vB_BpoS-Gurke TaxID=2948599 RepID=A0A9E7N1N1_9CAUD|nr:hypothetical protein GURKE_00560 [Brevundimonas phage vB_BpoS-Gurke]
MIALKDCKEPRPVDDPRALIGYGWAPGDYVSQCHDCGSGHIAAKRSLRCQDCAEKIKRLHDNPPKAVARIDVLLKDLHKAKGPVRTLDWRIAEILDLPEPWKTATDLWPPFMAGSKLDQSIPQFTASVDAAIALAIRIVPGLYMRVIEFDDEPSATPAEARVYGQLDGVGHAPTEALALVIASFIAYRKAVLAEITP